MDNKNGHYYNEYDVLRTDGIIVKIGNRKKIILVDMDGVLANFEASCLAIWRERYPTFPFIPLKDRVGHDVRKDYARLDTTYSELMNAIIHEDDFYDNLPVIEGASTALDEMIAEGYVVFICSAPLRSARCMAAKIQWIAKNIGKQWVERIVLTRDKTLIHGDILIDDKPQVTGLILNPAWTHILFDQPYNRHEIKNRITEWHQWRSVINTNK